MRQLYKKQLYIFELKTDKPKMALKQIHKKNYARKYINNTITIVGLQIDFNERNVINFAFEKTS